MGQIFIDLRTVRQGQNPRLKFATYFAADRSFVLLHALKSCINGHRSKQA